MRKSSLWFFSFGLSILLATACAVNPVTGQRELMLISEAQEIELGRSTDGQIRQQYGVYNDPALTEYVRGVGMALVPHTHRSALTYHFSILDTPVINAFAVPGGYIYVTRGVLAMMSSEAELAVVLGHELGHVNARHSARKMSQLLLVQVGLAVGSALSETFQELSGIAGVGIQLLFLKFSRDDERQADWLGVEYSRRGRYNPATMIDFFGSLQKLGDLSGGHSLPGFLSTHPLTTERIQNTREMLLAGDPSLKVAGPAYLNHIDSMIYGQDPRQGYIENGEFTHPAMRFSFSFPPDWQLENSPSQVTLAPKDGNGAVILQIDESSESLESYAAKKASTFENRQFIQEQRLNINGLASFQQLYDIPQESSESLRTRMSFIQYDKHIYSFTSISTQSDFNKYDFQFGTIVGSFKKLTDRSRLNRQPQRVRLVKADGRSSLRQIFKKQGMSDDLSTKMAIMNGLDIGAVPERGRRIKVIKQ